MLKTIIDKDTRKEYSIQIKNMSGENPMLCPVCSHTRKKKADKCFSFNGGMNAGQCNHCGVIFHAKTSTFKVNKKRIKPLVVTDTKNKYIRSYFKERKIPLFVAINAGVTTDNRYFNDTKKNSDCICFNFLKGCEIFKKKFKTLEKNFMSEGTSEFFYNHNGFIDSALFSEEKTLIVTEGEDDCLSYITAGFKGVVSLPNGCNKLDFLNNYDKYFEVIKKIYIAVDQDEEGWLLEQEIIRRYNNGNCYKVNLKDCKDANEYLVKYGSDALALTIDDAKVISTNGVITLPEVEDKAWNLVRNGYPKGISTGFPELDKLFTWRLGEITLFSGYANHGKTSFLANLAVIKSIINGWKWAIFTPEYGVPEDFYLDMCEIYLGKTMVSNKLGLRTATDEQVQQALDFIGEHFLFVYPKDKMHTFENVMKEVTNNVRSKGIKGVIIDPFNQLYRSSTTGARDIEVQQFCRLAKQQATQHQLAFCVVVHPKTANEKNPSEPNQNDIEGGDSWGKNVDNLMTIHRPNFHNDLNSTQTFINLHKVKRQKQVGKRGRMILEYDKNTYRYYNPFGMFTPFPNPDKVNYRNDALNGTDMLE